MPFFLHFLSSSADKLLISYSLAFHSLLDWERAVSEVGYPVDDGQPEELVGAGLDRIDSCEVRPMETFRSMTRRSAVWSE
jgi:hypothetical protein